MASENSNKELPTPQTAATGPNAELGQARQAPLRSFQVIPARRERPSTNGQTRGPEVKRVRPGQKMQAVLGYRSIIRLPHDMSSDCSIKIEELSHEHGEKETNLDQLTPQKQHPSRQRRKKRPRGSLLGA